MGTSWKDKGKRLLALLLSVLVGFVMMRNSVAATEIQKARLQDKKILSADLAEEENQNAAGSRNSTTGEDTKNRVSDEEISLDVDLEEGTENETDTIPEEEDCEVVLTINGSGSVKMDDTLVETSVFAAENTEIDLLICPDAGYMIQAVRLDGTDISVSADAFMADGSYLYSLAVVQSCAVEIDFAEIPNADPQTDFSGTGLTLVYGENNETLPVAETVYAAGAVTIQPSQGKVIRLGETGEYTENAEILKSQELSFVYLRDAVPSGFGSETKVIFSASVYIVVDTVKPSLTIDEDKIWVQGNVASSSVTGSAKDDILLNRVVYAERELQESEILAELDHVITNFEEGCFHASDLQLNDSINTFYFYAVDQAGNCSDGVSFVVVRDGDAPAVTEFHMETAGGDFMGVTSPYPDVTKMPYGFFFHEDTIVTIYASDGDGETASGVEKILYYTMRVDSVERKIEEVEVDGENKISFAIPAGFKGQIYACAKDMVGNEGEYITPTGVVVEDKEQHDQEEHILIKMPETSLRDSEEEENALYSENVTADITVIDTISGIHTIEWSVEASYDTGNNQHGTVNIDALGALDLAGITDGWDIIKTDGNLVTEIKKSVLISNDSNGIVLKAKMTDRAGNSSEQEITFSIDKTSPVFSLKFETDTQDAAYKETYRERKAIITVTERNFNAEDITVEITNTYGVIPEISEWETTKNEQDPNQTISMAEISFTEDGNYTLELSGRDLANHLAESVRAEDFTIDHTSSEIRIQLDTANGYEEKTESGSHFWYREIPVLFYSVSDYKDGKKGSGLYERKIYINDESLDDYERTYTPTDYKNALQEETGDIIITDPPGMQEGKNVVEVWFRDIAGNENSSLQEVYIDRHVPEITGFKIEKAENSQLSTILNTLTFGTFFNEKVILTVYVEDNKNLAGEIIPSSGLKDVTLYFDGTAYQTIAVENGKSEVKFTLPADAVLTGNKKIYLNADITAMVTDHAGNQSIVTDMTTGNSNLNHLHLMVETVDPEIVAVIQKEDYKKDGVIFNNSDTGFTVTAADQESGLRTVTIQINDTVLVEEHYQESEKITEKTYEVNTKDALPTKDNWYQMKITVVDNAGNSVSSLYPDKGMYKDEQFPEIVKFEMKAEGTKEADGSSLSYKETNYGYYFLEDTTVSVYASDGTAKKDSGVKEIRYYTVSSEGVSGSIKTAKVDKENKIKFKVSANFKGQIYACAWDNVENSTEKYVTPSGVIIETSKQHKKEKHISIQKEDASYKDNNGNELYESDVDLDITVTDTYSGIRQVEWSVESPYDTGANQSGRLEIDNAGKFMEGSNAGGWKKSEKDKNLITELKKTIQVSNNSNDIIVKVKMTDRSGNASSKKISFSIDKTSPEISITFDNESPDAEYQDIYKDDRTATITVKERNFDANAITASVTNTDGSIPQLSSWETIINESNPDETENIATIHFTDDGDYTLEAEGCDLAKNQAQAATADDFTIDKTKPVISVSYNNNNAINGNYYASEQTAVIEITEHNFSPERVKIIGTATDNGREIGFPQEGGFSTSGDVHTASIACGADGLYRFDVEYTDKAGNEAERYTGEEYYVDMTEPQIEISGVENMSANNGDVIPVISLTDTNYDMGSVEITLSGANRGSVEIEGTYASLSGGQVYTMKNFPEEQEYDDLYTLTATLRDKAGNENTDSIIFSVNRFGSVYVLDESLKSIGGSYIQNEIDVKLSEVNVDSLDNKKTRIVLDTNGVPRDLVKGSDYTIKEYGGNGAWHQYDYIIDKSLFEGDGRYIVTLYSEDAAGNINENIDETKRAEISFGVDKTSPVVVPIDIESNTQYPVDIKSATVTVHDNLLLDGVEIYIGGEKCEYTTDGDGYTFTVPSSTKPQDITISAVDAAKNRTNYILSGVLITTNLFIRWYNNKPLFAGTLGAAAIIGGGVVGAVIVIGKRRRRKEK